jgi:LacI family repressor for deo operon, udp, cdd, tsx, nupC, and nupG
LAVTMQDVADKAGVSIATVSRVLNEKDSIVPISKDTRQRILRISEELGYRPNLLARALRTQRTNLISVIIRDVGDPFHALVIKGIDQVTRDTGYHFLLSHVEPTSTGSEYVQIFQMYNADGMIIVGDLVDKEVLLAEVLDAFPYTVVTGQESIEGIPRVIVDNQGGIGALLEYLYSLGHHEIGFAYNPQIWDMQKRLEAFLSHTEVLGLPLMQERIVAVPSTLGGGEEALNAMLDQPVPPTAIVFANDRMAIGAMRVAHDRGIHIPGDLSITGFDDIPFAACTTPRITTVRQPIIKIGETAASLLIKWMDDVAEPAQESVTLPVELVIRESTAPPTP